MTSELEKNFFDTFGIEPKSYLVCTSCWDCIDAQPCEQCHYGKLIENEYPKITDRILLELICLTGNTDYFLITSEGVPIDIEGLKDSVLNILIMYSKFHKDLKHQIQTLFKEDNE